MVCVVLLIYWFSYIFVIFYFKQRVVCNISRDKMRVIHYNCCWIIGECSSSWLGVVGSCWVIDLNRLQWKKRWWRRDDEEVFLREESNTTSFLAWRDVLLRENLWLKYMIEWKTRFYKKECRWNKENHDVTSLNTTSLTLYVSFKLICANMASLPPRVCVSDSFSLSILLLDVSVTFLRQQCVYVMSKLWLDVRHDSCHSHFRGFSLFSLDCLGRRSFCNRSRIYCTTLSFSQSRVQSNVLMLSQWCLHDSLLCLGHLCRLPVINYIFLTSSDTGLGVSSCSLVITIIYFKCSLWKRKSCWQKREKRRDVSFFPESWGECFCLLVICTSKLRRVCFSCFFQSMSSAFQSLCESNIRKVFPVLWSVQSFDSQSQKWHSNDSNKRHSITETWVKQTPITLWSKNVSLSNVRNEKEDVV